MRHNAANRAISAAKLLHELDASREHRTGRVQNEPLPEQVARIYDWYRAFKDIEGTARIVTLDEIAANDHNLVPYDRRSPLWDAKATRGFNAFTEVRVRVLRRAFNSAAKAKLVE
jgi:type I restriction-modification system DNA methylase subunit